MKLDNEFISKLVSKLNDLWGQLQQMYNAMVNLVTGFKNLIMKI